ncbi:MAG: PD-(D/E)XK nuclease domain-containing protein, partial [Proteobacteria bacterium]|nr:PD-(D/E)XK nuclease domain-containing protein [Pseudomonadota bacterium]
KTVLYCAMVRNSLQKVVLLNFLLARNRFRTNYNATFLWDSSGFYAENQYHVIREFPTGKGFADIVLLPKRRVQKPAMVIELKFKKDVRAAIDQIHDNQYPGKLHDFYGELILVGISYDKRKAHDCVIERFEREAE